MFCLGGSQTLIAQAGCQRAAVAGQDVTWLVQAGEPFNHLCQQAHEAVKLIAVDTGDLYHDVDARPAELCCRDYLQRLHAPTCVPDGTYAQCV